MLLVQTNRLLNNTSQTIRWKTKNNVMYYINNKILKSNTKGNYFRFRKVKIIQI